MDKYVIGLDFGTLSARALLVRLSDGKEICSSEYVYPHSILSDEYFGRTLDKNDAFQHPKDYLEALCETVKGVLDTSGTSAKDILGVGIDFTSSTVLPTDKDGTPLCFSENFKNEPQAYVKLWKHHSAQKEADEMTSLAIDRGEEWLDIYGGKVSSEWLIPKLYETLHKAPEVFDKTERFLEAADWLVWLLTGEQFSGCCMAGFKALWNENGGYPSKEYLSTLDKNLENIVGTKICERVLPTGSVAGYITEEGAKLCGLLVGTAVAVPIIDAHAALPSAGIIDEGKLMLILGTSSCHIVLGKNDVPVKGICGRVKDGCVEGFVAYEAGQACSGDIFDWFVHNCVPASYEREAKIEGLSIHTYLTKKAERLSPGENGIIALDWFNGNRTPYADYDLKGMILGITLKTKPEEIYRALIEATAFGTKAICDLYEESGVPVYELYAAGGIANKNKMLMQIYSDILGKKIRVTESTQAGAKGSALFASVACGYYKNLSEAAKIIADKCETVYTPNKENTEKYKKLYEKYITLSKYFAKENGVMREL